MQTIDAQIIQALLTTAIATGSAVIAAVSAANKVIKENEHRFTVLETGAVVRQAMIDAQGVKLDKIMDCVSSIQSNCIAHKVLNQNR